LRRPLGALAEHLGNHDCIWVSTVNDPPRHGRISDPEFVTASPNRRHRPRVRHSKPNSLLQLAKQKASFDAGLRGEGRGCHLAVQPNQRLVLWAHARRVYVQTDISATSNLTTQSSGRVR
jgi:hypothetical protein